MSGAALWIDDRIVGVIARHHRTDGLGRLTAVRLVPELPGLTEPLPDVIRPRVSDRILTNYRKQVDAIVRLACGVASATLLAMGLVLSAPAATAATATSAGSVADTCAYTVRYNWTPVQENPDTDSVVRKYKHAGERVTGPCWAEYDTEGGTWFTAVYCSCASDGIGWIRSYWLY